MNKEQIQSVSKQFNQYFAPYVEQGLVSKEAVNHLFKELFADDDLRENLLSEFAPEREFYQNACSLELIVANDPADVTWALDELVEQTVEMTMNPEAEIQATIELPSAQLTIIYGAYFDPEGVPGVPRVSGQLVVAVQFKES